MSFADIIILAVVQGFTEWLPISSSGHLILLQQFFHMNTPVYYDILLHFATLIVILLVFYKDIEKIVRAWARREWQDEYSRLGFYVILGTIPIAFVGFFFGDLILQMFTNTKIIGLGFLLTAILLFATKYADGKEELNAKYTTLIGVMQVIALLPGISRSGTTLSSSLLLKVKREHAITFSFLLAVPAILGAAILEYEPSIITGQMVLGMITAIVVGYVSLTTLIKIVNHKKLYMFGWYCILIGIISLLL